MKNWPASLAAIKGAEIGISLPDFVRRIFSPLVSPCRIVPPTSARRMEEGEGGLGVGWNKAPESHRERRSRDGRKGG